MPQFQWKYRQSCGIKTTWRSRMMLSIFEDDYDIETKWRVIIWVDENDWLDHSDI